MIVARCLPRAGASPWGKRRWPHRSVRARLMLYELATGRLPSQQMIDCGDLAASVCAVVPRAPIIRDSACAGMLIVRLMSKQREIAPVLPRWSSSPGAARREQLSSDSSSMAVPNRAGVLLARMPWVCARQHEMAEAQHLAAAARAKVMCC